VLGEIRQQRIGKVHQLREQGIDPSSRCCAPWTATAPDPLAAALGGQ
jgi:hypothetical protein